MSDPTHPDDKEVDPSEGAAKKGTEQESSQTSTSTTTTEDQGAGPEPATPKVDPSEELSE